MGLHKVQIQLLMQIAELAEQERVKTFIVGGLLRDLLLKQDLQDVDLDFLVEGNAFQFARCVQEQVGGSVKSFQKFLTSKILFPDKLQGIQEIDFAQARAELYPQPGSLPEVRPADLQRDLSRRDFSINALAVSIPDVLRSLSPDASLLAEKIAESVIDLHGGLKDLQGKQIRVLHDQSFIDDPTRLFRACRYRVRLSAQIEPATQSLFEQALATGALKSISMFRIHNECLKALDEPKAHQVFEEFALRGLSWGSERHSHQNLDSLLRALTRFDALFEALPMSSLIKDLKRKLGSCLLFKESDAEHKKQYFKLRNYSKSNRDSIIRLIEGKPLTGDQEQFEHTLLEACLGQYDMESARSVLRERL